MAQLALDFDTPRVPSNGTATSRAAADSMVPHVGRLEAVVLEAIKAAGARGLTGDEIEVACSLSHQTTGPRIVSLRGLGLVWKAIDNEGNTVKRPTRTGRMAIVWVATPET